MQQAKKSRANQQTARLHCGVCAVRANRGLVRVSVHAIDVRSFLARELVGRGDFRVVHICDRRCCPNLKVEF
eukprot:150605-Pleurochrysis_carterae.AAC.1